MFWINQTRAHAHRWFEHDGRRRLGERSKPGNVSCAPPQPFPDAICVQDCGPPVARPSDPPRAWQWLSPADAENRKTFGCPRCLPAEALIATPRGEIPIGSLVAGALVYSTDEAGQRIVVPIVRVGSTPAPRDHALVVIVLSDGREVTASPGHPTADARALGALITGDSLDSATNDRLACADLLSDRLGVDDCDRIWSILQDHPTTNSGNCVGVSRFHQHIGDSQACLLEPLEHKLEPRGIVHVPFGRRVLGAAPRLEYDCSRIANALHPERRIDVQASFIAYAPYCGLARDRLADECFGNVPCSDRPPGVDPARRSFRRSVEIAQTIHTLFVQQTALFRDIVGRNDDPREVARRLTDGFGNVKINSLQLRA